MFTRRDATWRVKRQSKLDATNALFVMGFIVLVSSRRETPSQYGEGRNISISCLSSVVKSTTIPFGTEILKRPFPAKFERCWADY